MLNLNTFYTLKDSAGTAILDPEENNFSIKLNFFLQE